MLETNYFRNCALTVDDNKRTLYIYGPDIEGLKEKMTRGRSKKIEKSFMVSIPDTIKELHPRVDFSANYFFVQGIDVLHNISSGYGFRTVVYLKDYKRKYNENIMLNVVKRCIHVYHTRRLTVNSLNTDNKFACIRNSILPTNLNMVAAEEHVGNVKKLTRTVKEDTLCHVHRLPYEQYTKLMVSKCVTKTIKD